MDQFKWALYWRNSLADAESGKGSLKESDVSSFTDVGTDLFKKGMLTQDIVDRLFSNENLKVKIVPVIYRPTVLIKRLEHGKELTGVFPQIISPLICPLWVSVRTVFDGPLFTTIDG